MRSKHIHVIGFSMGTAVASKTAQKVQKKILIQTYHQIFDNHLALDTIHDQVQALGLRRLARVTLLDPCPAQAVQASPINIFILGDEGVGGGGGWSWSWYYLNVCECWVCGKLLLRILKAGDCQQ